VETALLALGSTPAILTNVIASRLTYTLVVSSLAACSSVVDESSLSTSGLELSRASQECFAPSADSTFDAASPDVATGAEASCQIDGKPLKRCALRWDLSSVEPGRKIDSAFVELESVDGSRGRYTAYALIEAWDEAQVTWPTAPQARGSAKLFTFRGYPGPHTVSLTPEGVEQVQTWIDAPATNFGVVIPSNDPHRTALATKERAGASGVRLCVNFR
jgi:hypothetical protein